MFTRTRRKQRTNTVDHKGNRVDKTETEVICAVCGLPHTTEECTLVNNGIRVQDAELPKKVFLTLPSGLKILQHPDGSYDVISELGLASGTQFGPFLAPKISRFNPLCSYMLKIFKGAETQCFLDTTDNNKCNWMSLVRFVEEPSLRNCICYQLKNEIYFSVVSEIKSNQQLIVAYSPGYLAQLQKCKLSNLQDNTSKKIHQIGKLSQSEKSWKDEEIKIEHNITNESKTTIESSYTQNNYHDHDYVVPTSEEPLPPKDTFSVKRSSRKRKLSTQIDPDFGIRLEENALNTETDGCSDYEGTISSSTAPKRGRRLYAVYALEFWRCKFCHEKVESIEAFAIHLIDHYKTIGAARTEKDRIVRSKLQIDEKCPNPLNPTVVLNRLRKNQQSLSIINDESSTSITDSNYYQKNDGELDEKIKTTPSYPYFCDICVKQKKFNRAEYIIRHLRNHTGKELFCTSCCQRFTTKEEQTNHNCNGQSLRSSKPSLESSKSWKTNEKRSTCKICRRNFTNNGDDAMKNHVCRPKKSLAIDKDISVILKCEACEDTFTKSLEFEKHLKSHDKSSFICPVCGKVLSNETLKIHTTICKVLRRFVDCKSEDLICPILKCGRSFKDLQVFKDHLGMHTHPFQCPSCGLRLKTANEIRSHVCETIVCDGCELAFTSLNSLKNHISVSHGVPQHYCFECTFPFVTAEGYMKHGDCELQRVLKSKNLNNLGKSPNYQDESLLYICEVCGMRYSKWSSMKTHRYTHAPKKYSCQKPGCGKSFTRKELLADHFFVHGEAQFSCEICSKKFKSKKSLDVHMRIHNGIRPYQCSICGRPFTQKVNLRTHEMTHIPEDQKGFMCHYHDCDKKFSSKEYLKFHIEAHEKGKTYSCDVDACNKKFVRMHMLNQHKRTAHGNHRFKCEFCVPNLFVRQKHSLFRHLTKRHPDASEIWNQEGYGEKMYIPGDGRFTHPSAKSRVKNMALQLDESSATEEDEQNEEMAIHSEGITEDIEIETEEIVLGDADEFEDELMQNTSQGTTNMVLLQLDNSGRYVIAFPHQLQKVEQSVSQEMGTFE